MGEPLREGLRASLRVLATIGLAGMAVCIGEWGGAQRGSAKRRGLMLTAWRRGWDLGGVELERGAREAGAQTGVAHAVA